MIQATHLARWRNGLGLVAMGLATVAMSVWILAGSPYAHSGCCDDVRYDGDQKAQRAIAAALGILALAGFATAAYCHAMAKRIAPSTGTDVRLNISRTSRADKVTAYAIGFSTLGFASGFWAVDLDGPGRILGPVSLGASLLGIVLATMALFVVPTSGIIQGWLAALAVLISIVALMWAYVAAIFSGLALARMPW